jgi:hypothetical protein
MSRTSSYYVGTIPNDEDMPRRVALARSTVNKVNALLRSQGSRKQYRTLVRGRLGPNNPNAHEYHVGGKHWRWSSIVIRPEHSVRFDLYVVQRRD